MPSRRSNEETGPPTPGSMRWRRLAEVVADQIRERIVRGDLGDGALLPKEAELREQYPVNVQSLREALRILEAEGLLQVRRGNRGGSVVHRPTPANVAYSLSLVLAMSDVDIDDVGTALHSVEPECAALCARREDRGTAVVPILRALHTQSLEQVDDLVAATTLSRRFHETLVSHCGNQSLIVLAGALEALWSSHVTDWVSERADPQGVPAAERREALAVHGQILRCIEDGDAEAARSLTSGHLHAVQFYPRDLDRTHVPLDPAIARDRLFFS